MTYNLRDSEAAREVCQRLLDKGYTAWIERDTVVLLKLTPGLANALYELVGSEWEMAE
jgi:hypothetical protein